MNKILLYLPLLAMAGCQTLKPVSPWQIVSASDNECCTVKDVRLQVEQNQLQLSGIVYSNAMAGLQPAGQIEISVEGPKDAAPKRFVVRELQHLSRRHHQRDERTRFLVRIEPVPVKGSRISIRFERIPGAIAPTFKL